MDKTQGWKAWQDRAVRLSPWLVLALTIAVLLFRRWDQAAYPALWVEEGWTFLPQYIDKGWLYLFEPVNGYIILPSKLVQLIALHLSFADLPFWTMIFTFLASGLVALAIATAPINLPFRVVAAVVPFLVPMIPEPMGAGEYTFWFVGLLAVVALLWRTDAKRQWLRLGYGALSALSSPLAVAVTPLMIVRAAFARKLWDIATAGVMLGISALQVWLVVTRETLDAGGVSNLKIENIPLLIEKFVGDYFINTNDWISLAVGVVALLIVGGLCAWAFVARRQVTPAVLFICFGLSIAASIARVSLEGIDATSTGPRYFLYPFTLLAWTMMALAVAPIYQRVAMLAAAAVPLLQMTSPWYVRTNVPVDWRGMAVACIKGREPPVSRVEKDKPPWPALAGRLTLDGRFEMDGVNYGLGFNKIDGAAGSALAGDAAVGSARFDLDAPTRAWLAIQVLTGPDGTGQRLELLGETAVRVELGPLTSQLKDGWAYIVVPAPPGVSGVRITDEGTGWGQWSAIGKVLTGDKLPGGKMSTYTLPVHVDGKLDTVAEVKLTQDQCARMSRGALLDLPLRTVIR